MGDISSNTCQQPGGCNSKGTSFLQRAKALSAAIKSGQVTPELMAYTFGTPRHFHIWVEFFSYPRFHHLYRKSHG